MSNRGPLSQDLQPRYVRFRKGKPVRRLFESVFQAQFHAPNLPEHKTRGKIFSLPASVLERYTVPLWAKLHFLKQTTGRKSI